MYQHNVAKSTIFVLYTVQVQSTFFASFITAFFID